MIKSYEVTVAKSQFKTLLVNAVSEAAAVRMAEEAYAAGEYDFCDPCIQHDKYDILHHPNVSLSADGGAKPYIHGTAERAEARITLGTLRGDALDSITLPDGIDLLDLELLSEEEVLALPDPTT